MTDHISRQAAIDGTKKIPDLTVYAFCSFLDMISNLPSVQEQRWIPVTERLPEDDTEVVVSIHDDAGDTSFDYTTVGWHFKGEWIVNDERNYYVSAWMPLPEPYKAHMEGAEDAGRNE